MTLTSVFECLEKRYINSKYYYYYNQRAETRKKTTAHKDVINGFLLMELVNKGARRASPETQWGRPKAPGPAEDDHSPLCRLLKTLRLTPPSLTPAPALFGGFWVVSAAVDEDRVMAPGAAHNTRQWKGGRPVSIDADVLCSLTDVSIFYNSLSLSLLFFLYEPLMFSSKNRGGGWGGGGGWHIVFARASIRPRLWRF